MTDDYKKLLIVSRGSSKGIRVAEEAFKAVEDGYGIQFITGNVPVSVAAKVYGKDPNWVRAGLITGYLPIGKATRNGKQITDLAMQGHGGRINYYISPKLLYEQTGYLWDGTRKIPSVL